MDGKAMVDDIHATIRHEVVMGLGKAFEPHRPGNLLDQWLVNFDKHGKDMLSHTMYILQGYLDGEGLFQMTDAIRRRGTP